MFERCLRNHRSSTHPNSHARLPSPWSRRRSGGCGRGRTIRARSRPDGWSELKQNLLADREMLWARPLIALPDGTVICGNQRLLAARELGWETIPVADGRPRRRSGRGCGRCATTTSSASGTSRRWPSCWPSSRLAGSSLALTGFASGELDRILAGIDADRSTRTRRRRSPSGEPDSQPGEIYELGQHRLACGDARDPDLLAD